MMEAVKVLDHGFVRLIDHMGDDLSIVRAARVSFNAAWRTGENEKSDKRLIHYLWSHKHTTPFEAVTFSFEVKAPIFVIRQWHRHRTWSYNEVSARYTELPGEFYVPHPEVLGVQSTDNKQGRAAPVNEQWSISQRARIHEACVAAVEAYKDLLAAGVSRELARSVLPVATYTHMFATVNLLNLLKFLTLRCDPHAQWEIQQYANAMRNLVESIVPVAIDAWRTFR